VKIRLLLVVGVAALAFAGVAQASGMFEGSDPKEELLQRERTLVRTMHGPGHQALGRRGPRGPRGPRGFRGPAGPQGSFSAVTMVKGPTTVLAPFPEAGAVGVSSVNCPAGSRAVSGGWQGGGILATVGYNAPGSGEWSVIMTNNNEFNSTSFNAIAICVS
jgi:hypothetical protein